MKNLIYLFLMLFLITSCQQEDFQMKEPSSNQDKTKQNPYRISLDEALSVADDLFSQIDEPATRSSARTIHEVQYLVDHGQKTRSKSASDTLFYLINYENDKGFALLSADSRMAPILAISPEGSLDLDNVNEESGLSLFVENLYNVESNFVLDTTRFNVSIDHPIPIDPGEPTKTTVYYDIKPMLKINPRHWHQAKPFNTYCPVYNSNNARSATGCVPLACTMVMSYHEWPLTYASLNLNWRYINSLTTSNTGSLPDWLSRFIYEVGKTLHAKFGHTAEGATGVTVNDIKKYFHQFGYEKLSDPIPLKHSSVPHDLQQSPLLVVGNGVKNPGHAWVIDGYLSYSITGSLVATPEHSISYSLYHCVWGWGGDNNGYFLWRDGTEVSSEIPYQGDGDNNKDTQTYKFKELKYFNNIKPIK